MKTSNDSTLSKNNKVDTSNDSILNKNNNTESLNNSTHININNKHTRQRGRPRKAIKELQNSHKKSQDTSQKHVTKTIKPYAAINYNLRSAQNSNNTDFNTANYDVRTNQQFAYNTISQAYLPFILPSTQQPHLITPKNSAQQMDNPTNEKTNTTTGSTSPKKTFSMTNYLSTPPKQKTIGTTPENKEQLSKPPDNIFNTKLIAAMTNRDTVLREVRDCILTGDEQRCKKLSKQIHATWRSLSVQNGCLLLDNKLAIPNSLKESVIDVLHSTHPGAWGMTELGQRIWWPFINRDLINKSKTCRPCTEFGKNLKNKNPKSRWAPLPQCSEPNEEIQLDFGGPIIDGQGREVYFLACIDRFSKFPTLKLVTNANGPNIEKFLNKHIAQHGVPLNIRLDQARCLKGNKVKLLCAKHNINLIYAPANDHRFIGLVERLIQTVKRRLGCIKLNPNQRPFNIKNALRNISFELRNCRKKYSKLSPFEAYYGRKPNTTLTNITTKPKKIT